MPSRPDGMSTSPSMAVHLLADRPHLIEAVGVLRWQEWGYGAELPEEWIAVTASESGRDALPVTLVATLGEGQGEDQVAGAVALGEVDDAIDDASRAGRSPWLLGMVVRRDLRLHGVGRLLVHWLEDLARARGYGSVWVATGDDALGFYQRCGWQVEESHVPDRDGRPNNVLVRSLRPSE
jgi:GNAT superfamily N-acetyltransferase